VSCLVFILTTIWLHEKLKLFLLYIHRQCQFRFPTTQVNLSDIKCKLFVIYTTRYIYRDKTYNTTENKIYKSFKTKSVVSPNQSSSTTLRYWLCDSSSYHCLLTITGRRENGNNNYKRNNSLLIEISQNNSSVQYTDVKIRIWTYLPIAIFNEAYFHLPQEGVVILKTDTNWIYLSVK
jgi:hypothetical protein